MHVHTTVVQDKPSCPSVVGRWSEVAA